MKTISNKTFFTAAVFLSSITTFAVGFMLGMWVDNDGNCPQSSYRKDLESLQSSIAETRTIQAGTPFQFIIEESVKFYSGELPAGFQINALTQFSAAPDAFQVLLLSEPVYWNGQVVLPLGTRLWLVPGQDMTEPAAQAPFL